MTWSDILLSVLARHGASLSLRKLSLLVCSILYTCSPHDADLEPTEMPGSGAGLSAAQQEHAHRSSAGRGMHREATPPAPRSSDSCELQPAIHQRSSRVSSGGRPLCPLSIARSTRRPEEPHRPAAPLGAAGEALLAAHAVGQADWDHAALLAVRWVILVGTHYLGD